MTRKHFRMIAEIVSKSNPRFDRSKFMQACGALTLLLMCSTANATNISFDATAANPSRMAVYTYSFVRSGINSIDWDQTLPNWFYVIINSQITHRREILRMALASSLSTESNIDFIVTNYNGFSPTRSFSTADLQMTTSQGVFTNPIQFGRIPEPNAMLIAFGFLISLMFLPRERGKRPY